MNTNKKTIKQIADEIGVSKQAIFYKINKEPLSKELESLTSKENGVLMVSLDGEKLIKKSFIGKTTVKENDSLTPKENTSFDGLLMAKNTIKILEKELEEKNKQLQNKDTLIEQQQKNINDLTVALENTTKSLNAAQLLHAGTIQKQLVEEVNLSKNDNEIETKKKWWEFWKAD